MLEATDLSAKILWCYRSLKIQVATYAEREKNVYLVISPITNFQNLNRSSKIGLLLENMYWKKWLILLRNSLDQHTNTFTQSVKMLRYSLLSHKNSCEIDRILKTYFRPLQVKLHKVNAENDWKKVLKLNSKPSTEGFSPSLSSTQ